MNARSGPVAPSPEERPEREAAPPNYDRLRKIAALYLQNERPDHTLQPTALVHEAWLRLASYRTQHELSEREHRALVVQVMRRVLTDHARRKQSAKRYGGRELDELHSVEAPAHGSEIVLEVNEALVALAEVDAQLAEIVELRFFGGLSLAEIADHTELSVRTIKRRWQLARAWLLAAMSSDGDDA